jgi:hypothetical protein
MLVSPRQQLDADGRSEWLRKRARGACAASHREAIGRATSSCSFRSASNKASTTSTRASRQKACCVGSRSPSRAFKISKSVSSLNTTRRKTRSTYSFERSNAIRPGQGSTPMGRLKYLTHDAEREKPVHFAWQLLDWPVPQETLTALACHSKAEGNGKPERSLTASGCKRSRLHRLEPPIRVSARASSERRSGPILLRATNVRGI